MASSRNVSTKGNILKGGIAFKARAWLSQGCIWEKLLCLLWRGRIGGKETWPQKTNEGAVSITRWETMQSGQRLIRKAWMWENFWIRAAGNKCSGRKRSKSTVRRCRPWAGQPALWGICQAAIHVSDLASLTRKLPGEISMQADLGVQMAVQSPR